ncbi:MAG: hypothetical protein LBQ54_02825 [Planctomycetaceae bacterium]|jgi:hypothetical protein|nr:hypothetical protein [Planctomycetaceae bacterium]
MERSDYEATAVQRATLPVRRHWKNVNNESYKVQNKNAGGFQRLAGAGY